MRTRLHHLVEESALVHAGRPAVTAGDETVTYEELWQLVRGTGAGLTRLGVAAGDRVAIYLDKRIETVVAILAASVANAVSVPINPVLKRKQVAHILADSGASVLITTPQRWSTIRRDVIGTEAPRVVLVGVDGGTPVEREAWWRPWNEVSQGSTSDLATRRGVDLDVAAILYTSGSTGPPKGVVLSHRNLLVGAESVSTYLGNTADDVILAALPLSFDAGLSQVTTAMTVGAHVVLTNYLLPRDLVVLCARHSVTGLTGVPPLWMQIAELDWPDEATASMRYFANTGGRMPGTTLKRLRDIFPSAQPFLMYGLTEAFRSTFLDPAEVDDRPDSIGKAIPNAEILVLDDSGRQCAPGQEGELVHRGPLVALGYWNDAERTAQRFRPLPGAPVWRSPEVAVFSGDRVVADEEGFLYFVGRNDEMLKTSGYRVSPTEIEETAHQTGLVRDAVAIGVQDERLGQRIVLVVAGRDSGPVDSVELLAQLRRELPLYMVPSEVVELEEVPRSPNGKFDRVRLRSELVT